MRSRTTAFVALVTACALVAIGAVASAVVSRRAAEPAPATAPLTRAAAAERPAAPARPALVFRSLDRSRGQASFGGLAVTSAPRPDAARPRLAGLNCERVYAAAAGGLCLARKGTLTSAYQARVLGPDLSTRHEIALTGVPGRARVSPDGRYGATTTFVSGHSYADVGKFSTQTTLNDMQRGKTITDLERFRITKGGDVIDSPDVNFWGSPSGAILTASTPSSPAAARRT